MKQSGNLQISGAIEFKNKEIEFSANLGFTAIEWKENHGDGGPGEPMGEIEFYDAEIISFDAELSDSVADKLIEGWIADNIADLERQVWESI